MNAQTIAALIAGPLLTGTLGASANIIIGKMRTHHEGRTADAEVMSAEAERMQAETDRERFYLDSIKFLQEQNRLWQTEANEWRQRFWRQASAAETVINSAQTIAQAQAATPPLPAADDLPHAP